MDKVLVEKVNLKDRYKDKSSFIDIIYVLGICKGQLNGFLSFKAKINSKRQSLNTITYKHIESRMNNFPAICFWPDWPDKFGLLKSGQEDLAGMAENWPVLIANK